MCCTLIGAEERNYGGSIVVQKWHYSDEFNMRRYIEYCNTKRPHQGIEHQIPMTKYTKIAA